LHGGGGKLFLGHVPDEVFQHLNINLVQRLVFEKLKNEAL
jgi:hypothetical protein